MSNNNNNNPTRIKRNEITLKPRGTGRTFEVLAKRCKTTPEALAVIIKAENNRIKEALEFNQEETIKALQNKIFGILELYTSAPVRTAQGITENARQLIAELMRLTITKFKFISVDEIKQAFDFAALEGLEFSAYYGKVTVPMYIKVLKHYIERRNLIRIEYDKGLKLLNSQSNEDKKNELNLKAQKIIIKNYTALVSQYVNGQKITLENIPYNWGEILAQTGLLNVELSIKQQIKDEALKMAINQLKRDTKNEKLNLYSRKAIKDTLNDYLNSLAQGQKATTPEKIKALQLTFYKKLVVLESIKNDALEKF